MMKPKRSRMLLHVCCGPCASACVPELKSVGAEVTLLFANSNIDTREEFDRRLRSAERLAEAEGVAMDALPYDHEEWLREVARGYEHEPERGERCARCFRYNLAKAAEYARARGFDSYTTSLTVSPHKPTQKVFAAANGDPRFARWNFKEHGGFARSVERAAGLGLYRQGYCGCEFSKERWIIHHRHETESTNADARSGRPRDVFTADFQTAGRGRLDHKWLSAPGESLLMSAVLSVEGMSPEAVSTLPLVAGLSVAKGLTALCGRGAAGPTARLDGRVSIKWPNDVLVDGKKIAGVLCERAEAGVIVGIGVNVRQRTWPADISGRAVSLFEATGRTVKTAQVRSSVLDELGRWHGIWREKGFRAVWPEIAAMDSLRGRTVSVLQTDDDSSPAAGVCGGICLDGSLDVGGTRVFAGEAHVQT